MKNHYYLLFTICYLLFAGSANAQPGNLDSDFDADGKLTTTFGTGIETAYATAVQTDGKIIAAGYCSPPLDEDFAMARYNTDGTLDATFGTIGKVTTNFTAGSDRAYSILIQPDGKIIMAGTVINSDYDFAMARYNSDGSLDLTFSVDGKVSTDFSGANNQCYTAALQADGKIILAGQTNNPSSNDFALIRYNADGTLDNSFGTNGKVSTSFGNDMTSATINALAVQADGKIVAAGEFRDGSSSLFALARYTADGNLDNTFSVDGKITTNAGDNFSQAYSLALQPDGKILAAGYAQVGGTNYFAVLRYKTDGTLDTGFDGDGITTTVAAVFRGVAYSVLLQPDGKIIGAGFSFNNSSEDFALVRFNTNGALDNTFGTGGTAVTAFTSSIDIAYATALTPDLKIVVAGTMFNGTDYDFAVARYLSGLNLGTLEFSANTSALIYPNPLNETTVLSFELVTNEVLKISIYDMQGRKIKTISENQFYAAGKHELSIDAGSLAGGQYLLVLENGKGKTVIRLQK